MQKDLQVQKPTTITVVQSSDNEKFHTAYSSLYYVSHIMKLTDCLWLLGL